MKKHGLIFLVLVTVFVAAGYLLYNYKDLFTTKPWTRQLTLDTLSRVASDPENNLYLIGNSKQDIYKIDHEGVLQYRIESGNRSDGYIENFTDIAVDDGGNLYAVSTLLDSFGLYVLEERIMYFGRDGQERRVLYRVRHDAGDGHLRIGVLQSLQIRDGTLHFFVNGETRVELMRVNDFGRTQSLFSSELPEGVYAAELTGTEPGQLYFVGKRGSLYSFDASGTPKQIYPPGTMESWTGITVPDALTADSLNRLYFVNSFRQEINRVDPKSPYLVERILSDDMLLEQGVDGTLAGAQHIHIADNGNVIVAAGGQVVVREFDGTISKVVSGAKIRTSETVLAWLYWLLLAGELLFAAYLFRFVYVHMMHRRSSLILKQIAVFIPILAVSMGFLSQVVFQSFNEKLKEEAFRELALVAHNGGKIIGNGLLSQINGPEDYGGAAYRELKRRIESVYDGKDGFDREGSYTTIYKYTDGRLYIVSDDNDAVNIFTPFELTEENLRVLEHGEIVYNEWTDANGRWVYALGPLYNQSGEIVGIYETGKDMIGLERHNRAVLYDIIRRIVVISAVVLLIFAALTFYLLSPLRSLRNSVSDLAHGRWDTEVHVRTRDEVGELGQRFNFMAEHIRGYISEITEMNKAYFRFVPQKFLKILGKDSILDAGLGNQVQSEMSVMVSNMRGFYDFSRELSPEENFKFVNSFLSRFGPVIREHKGIVNRYLGAGIMSLFPSRTVHALRAAVSMRETLEVYNGHRGKVGYRPIDIGIAIHKGPLMLGIIGEEQRLENNVISDQVNLTVMLERLTETLGCSILVTEEVMAEVKHSELFQYRSLGRVRIPEHHEPLQLYDVYQGDPDMMRNLKHKTKETFEQAILMYQEGRFYDARETFLEVIKQNRFDRAAQLYFYLSDKYYQRGTYEEWDGTLSA